MRRAYRHADVAGEMTRSSTGQDDRSIVIADGSPAELWAAHREHLSAQVQQRGGEPLPQGSLEAALWVTRRAQEHDTDVARRATRVLVALSALLGLVLGVLTAPLLDGPLLSLVLAPTVVGAMLILAGPWARVRLWYLRGIRPAFRDTAVRSETRSSV
jgi:hypothetical protein